MTYVSIFKVQFVCNLLLIYLFCVGHYNHLQRIFLFCYFLYNLIFNDTLLLDLDEVKGVKA